MHRLFAIECCQAGDVAAVCIPIIRLPRRCYACAVAVVVVASCIASAVVATGAAAAGAAIAAAARAAVVVIVVDVVTISRCCVFYIGFNL